MRFTDSFKTATLGLRHAKVRSLLTMLGIVIGIASVILLMSIGSSAQELILNQVKGIGSNLIFVLPGGSGGSRTAAPASAQGIVIKTLVARDVESLRRDPSVEKVAPEVRGVARAVSDQNDKAVTYEGVTDDFFVVRSMHLDSGYFFLRSDVDSYSRVAVIGRELATTLFGDRNPLGKSFRLNDITFRVAGVLAKSGIGPGGVDQDNGVFIPVTVAQKMLLGLNYYNFLTVQAKGAYDINYVSGRIASVLRQNHLILNPDKDDFTIRTQEDALSLLGNITSIMTIFLTAIASISLVVGGIGIMNIMLVSVVERTKEIGLRKAIGATNRDIMQQFLIESILLTFFGGAIGIGIGASLTFLVYIIMIKFTTISWVFTLPLSSILLAFGVSTLTGLAFGIYPARKAAIKNPIDALRYE